MLLLVNFYYASIGVTFAGHICRTRGKCELVVVIVFVYLLIQKYE